MRTNTTTLRLYAVGGNGTDFAWDQDIVLQTNGYPQDEHGSASDGTYVYMVDYGGSLYRTYSLATGELVYTGSGPDLEHLGSGFKLDNPTFFTHDHVTGDFIVGSYNAPGVLISTAATSNSAFTFQVAENTTAVTTLTASDVEPTRWLMRSFRRQAPISLHYKSMPRPARSASYRLPTTRTRPTSAAPPATTSIPSMFRSPTATAAPRSDHFGQCNQCARSSGRHHHANDVQRR